MANETPDYLKLYLTEVQGDFYGEHYYRERTADNQSAIVYADGEDKIRVSALIALTFNPGNTFEVGCAMGLMVKALRAQNVAAEGIDFSRWCIERVDPAVKDWARWGDILAEVPPSDQGAYDLVLALDVLEHLPPEKINEALSHLAKRLKPGGMIFTVIPAYGPNEFGPELYRLHRATWRSDAAAGVPFRDIPLDDEGHPHMGHLTHATIDWWANAFRDAGMRRLGDVEQLLHNRYDGLLDHGRRSFFLFAKSGAIASRMASGRLIDRIKQIPTLPEGFWTWERWEPGVWMRWTTGFARETIEVGGRTHVDVRAICNHPEIAGEPVRVQFRIDDQLVHEEVFSDHDWHSVRLPLSAGKTFAAIEIASSRTWTPDNREIAVGVSYEVRPRKLT
jgi:SAM-dependent methyltransferase